MNILFGSAKNEIESALRRYGYRILGKNQRELAITLVDGREAMGDLAAEYTAEKKGKKYVVCAVRGEGEKDPTEPALRRRLIEYDRVFGLHGVLLVDAEKGEVHEVRFKFPRERGIDFYFQFFIALFIIALVIGIIWLMVAVKLF